MAEKSESHVGRFLLTEQCMLEKGEGNTPDYGLKLRDEVRVVKSYSLISPESDIQQEHTSLYDPSCRESYTKTY